MSIYSNYRKPGNSEPHYDYKKILETKATESGKTLQAYLLECLMPSLAILKKASEDLGKKLTKGKIQSTKDPFTFSIPLINDSVLQATKTTIHQHDWKFTFNNVAYNSGSGNLAFYNALVDKFGTSFDKLKILISKFDTNYQMSDSDIVYRRGLEQEQVIRKLYKELSQDEKEKIKLVNKFSFFNFK